MNHINFAVEGGEIFGFLRLNGAGKSTTQRMLTTLLTAADPINDILAYNQHAVDTLNSLPPSAFSPPLDLLDALVASIQVSGE